MIDLFRSHLRLFYGHPIIFLFFLGKKRVRTTARVFASGIS